VQAKVQRLKTGPSQLREHTPTEKHAGLEASRWQPHHYSPCDGPVTYPGDTKILVKSSKERSGPTPYNKVTKTSPTFRGQATEIFSWDI